MVLIVLSLAALVWSIYATFAIGFHASDTHTTGDVDNWIWLVMAGSLIVLVVSSVVIGHLRDARQGRLRAG
jgi:O-antigen/teichoic acid export membrane protein